MPLERLGRLVGVERRFASPRVADERSSSRPSLPSTLPHRLMVFRFSVAATAGLLASAVNLVDGGPGAPLRFFLRHAALLVSLLDVLGLSFLPQRVLVLASAWHVDLRRSRTQVRCRV